MNEFSADQLDLLVVAATRATKSRELITIDQSTTVTSRKIDKLIGGRQVTAALSPEVAAKYGFPELDREVPVWKATWCLWRNAWTNKTYVLITDLSLAFPHRHCVTIGPHVDLAVAAFQQLLSMKGIAGRPTLYPGPHTIGILTTRLIDFVIDKYAARHVASSMVHLKTSKYIFGGSKTFYVLH